MKNRPTHTSTLQAEAEFSAPVKDSKKFDIVGRKEISDGVSILLGRPKGKPNATPVTVSYKFDEGRFKNKEAVRNWLKKNKVSGVKTIKGGKSSAKVGTGTDKKKKVENTGTGKPKKKDEKAQTDKKKKRKKRSPVWSSQSGTGKPKTKKEEKAQTTKKKKKKKRQPVLRGVDYSDPVVERVIEYAKQVWND